MACFAMASSLLAITATTTVVVVVVVVAAAELWRGGALQPWRSSLLVGLILSKP
jgi:hypothetical protein